MYDLSKLPVALFFAALAVVFAALASHSFARSDSFGAVLFGGYTAVCGATVVGLAFDRRTFTPALVALCLLGLVAEAPAQCKNGRCPLPARAPAAAPPVLPPAVVAFDPAKVEWFYHTDEADRTRVHLYVSGGHRGVLDVARLKFEPDAGDTVNVFDPPPPPRVGQATPVVPGGVDRSHMPSDGRSRFVVNGDEADEQAAFQAFAEADTLTDDSPLPWVVVVGPADLAARTAVVSDIRRSGVKARVKGYPAGHAAVKDYPPGAVHVQAPNGRLLDTLRSYDGPDMVKAAFDAALAVYNAAKDPGPGKPYPSADPPAPPAPPNAAPDAAPKTFTVPAWVFAFAGVAVLVLLTRSRT